MPKLPGDVQRLRQVRWFIVVTAAVIGAIIWRLIESRFDPPGYIQLVFVALVVVLVAPIARKRETHARVAGTLVVCNVAGRLLER